MLYGRRMDMQGRSKETGLNVLSTLTGASWRQCEDLDLPWASPIDSNQYSQTKINNFY